MEVGIIGGGIAGLYSALLLREQGCKVTVLEASSRLGGRIYSHHFPPINRGDDPFFEAGAMRLPLSSFHSCVFDFVRFINSKVDEDHQIEFLPYVLAHENNKIFLQGHMVNCDDKTLAAKVGLPERFHNRSAREILTEVMKPWIELLRADFEAGFKEVQRYDDMTFRQYLRNTALLPDAVIDYIELIMSQTNQYDLSFTDLMLQTLHFNTPQWVTVKNGLSRIIEEAANLLGSSVIRNAPVSQITELDGDKIEVVTEGLTPHRRVFDKVILAMPPAAIQGLRVRPKWSFLKEQAIRSIHEGPLYKMGLHFRTRFWEQVKPKDATFGGQSQTDLRIRWIVYPSNDIGTPGSGCLILYSGMTDAMRWSWLSREQRVKNALEDLHTFFERQGIDVYDQFIEAFDVCWPSGLASANTMYLPGQFSRFFESMKQPEGNVYFAGEHISRHHTWVAGGVESALETCQQLLDKPELLGLGANEALNFTKPVALGPEILDGLVLHDSPVGLPTLEKTSPPPEYTPTVITDNLDLNEKKGAEPVMAGKLAEAIMESAS